MVPNASDFMRKNNNIWVGIVLLGGNWVPQPLVKLHSYLPYLTNNKWLQTRCNSFWYHPTMKIINLDWYYDININVTLLLLLFLKIHSK